MSEFVLHNEPLPPEHRRLIDFFNIYSNPVDTYTLDLRLNRMARFDVKTTDDVLPVKWVKLHAYESWLGIDGLGEEVYDHYDQDFYIVEYGLNTGADTQDLVVRLSLGTVDGFTLGSGNYEFNEKITDEEAKLYVDCLYIAAAEHKLSPMSD